MGVLFDRAPRFITVSTPSFPVTLWTRGVSLKSDVSRSGYYPLRSASDSSGTVLSSSELSKIHSGLGVSVSFPLTFPPRMSRERTENIPRTDLVVGTLVIAAWVTLWMRGVSLDPSQTFSDISPSFLGSVQFSLFPASLSFWTWMQIRGRGGHRTSKSTSYTLSVEGIVISIGTTTSRA